MTLHLLGRVKKKERKKKQFWATNLRLITSYFLYALTVYLHREENPIFDWWSATWLPVFFHGDCVWLTGQSRTYSLPPNVLESASPINHNGTPQRQRVSTVHQLCSDHCITEYWMYGKIWLTVQVTWMEVGLRTTGLCSRTMTSPSSFCTCLWSTPFAGGLISAHGEEKLDRFTSSLLIMAHVQCIPHS